MTRLGSVWMRESASLSPAAFGVTRSTSTAATSSVVVEIAEPDALNGDSVARDQLGRLIPSDHRDVLVRPGQGGGDEAADASRAEDRD